MNKTINDAIAHLPEDVQAHLLKQWNTCGYTDIYDGVLSKYLSIMEKEWEASERTLYRLAMALNPPIEVKPRVVTVQVSKPVALLTYERRVFYLPLRVEELRAEQP